MMMIVTAETMASWRTQKVHETVDQYFKSNSGKWITDAVSSLGLPYHKVAWALGYNANGFLYSLMALPTDDTELSLAMQLNQMWQG